MRLFSQVAALTRRILSIGLFVILASSPLSAQTIGDELVDFFNRSGGAANVTHPKAMLGQQAGFITGGSLVRFRKR